MCTHRTKSLPLHRKLEVLYSEIGVLTSGPLKTERLSQETILNRYQQQDKADVAQSFRWLVLVAILKDELYVEHKAHGVKYEFQTLERFLIKWWPKAEGK